MSRQEEQESIIMGRIGISWNNGNKSHMEGVCAINLTFCMILTTIHYSHIKLSDFHSRVKRMFN